MQSFSYVGIPAFALIALGVLIRLSGRRLGGGSRAVAMAVIWFMIATPGPWMRFAAVRPLSFAKAWYFTAIFSFWIAVAAAEGCDHLARTGKRGTVIGALLVLLTAGVYLGRARLVLAPTVWSPVVAGQLVDYLQERSGPFRITGTPGAHIPNASRITGIEDARRIGPTMPLRYHLWWQLVDPDVLQRSYPTTRWSDHLASPLVGDFNISRVVQSRFPRAKSGLASIHDPRRRDASLSRWLVPPGFPVEARSNSILVHRSAGFLRPRVHFAERFRVVADLAAAVSAFREDSSLPQAESVLECRTPVSVPVEAHGTATVDYPSESRATVRVQSPTGGLVVLHDSYARGWRAKVDGQRVSVFPVNILSRGVLVSPGAHTIEFSYSPPGFATGQVIAFVTLLVLLHMWVSSGRAPDSQGQPATY